MSTHKRTTPRCKANGHHERRLQLQPMQYIAKPQQPSNPHNDVILFDPHCALAILSLAQNYFAFYLDSARDHFPFLHKGCCCSIQSCSLTRLISDLNSMDVERTSFLPTVARTFFLFCRFDLMRGEILVGKLLWYCIVMISVVIV
jgi:hypothetical protein